jgi:hypothetical protein
MSLAFSTEYPDPSIMETPEGNVERARQQRGKPHPAMHEKGTEEDTGGKQDYYTIECTEFE